MFVRLLRLYPATPGWGVRCGCVCLGSGFGCAPPLLAGVLGCVRVRVHAPLVPRHSWLGCAARSVCTPPLPAGVCGVGVCASAWVLAAPRHFWLGCWGVCVLVRPLRLYPATPGWGVRHGCVCFGLGFGCAPPLLAGVLGYLCVRVCSPLVPRHPWLGCAVWLCVLWLGFRLRPATPGWGVGVCVCWCARSACTPPLLAGLCGVGVCAFAWVSAAPRHSWLGCWGVCVFVCALRLYPTTPGWGVRRAPLVPRHSWLGCAALVCVLWLGFRLRPASPGWGVGVCVCSCARSACTPPLLARVCGVGVCALAWVSAAPRHSWLGCWGMCVFVCALRLYPTTPGWVVWRAPLVPHHSWLGCAAWVCVLWLGFWLRSATPGLGVGVCVCSCARSACTPPLLAGVCGVGVCAFDLVSAAPRHSWLGCWGVCVLVRPLRLYPATPGTGVRRGRVCFGLGFGCAPQLLAGVLGCVRVRVRAPLVPRHSWLGCAACSARTPPLLAGVCGVGVCALARVSAAPRHFWLGCWGVCVLVRPLRLYPATPGWGVRRGCVCFGLGFGCAPPVLAGVLGCVCARAPAPLVPRHSWPGCAAWVCVLWLGFWLRPATPGWGVGVCVCSCARSACTPPLLAGVCGVGVCALAWVSAAPRHSWLGCLGVCVLVRPLRLYPASPGWGVRRGCVCFGLGFGCAPQLLAGVLGCVCAPAPAPLVPRHSWLGCAAWVCVLWLGFRLRPATPGWGVGVCACSCVRSARTPPLLAGVCGVPVWCCVAPVPVPWFVACCARSPGLRHPVAVVAWSLSVCLGCGRRRASLACLVAPPRCAAPLPVWSLLVLRSAFPTLWCLSPPRGLAPPALLGGFAGHAEAGREPGSLCLPLAPAEAGALGSLRVVPARGPAMGLSLVGPSSVCLGLRALRWFACVDPVTDASGFPYRPSFDGGLGRCTGAVSCSRRHLLLRVGGRHARVPCVCACAHPSWPGRAGWPPGRVLVRLTFSLCRLVFLLCWAPSGLGLPPL